MFYIVIVFIVFLLDQITKYFAVMNLKFVNSKVIIKNFLEFTYVENRGAAFGIMQGRKIFFVLITLAAIGYILFFLFKKSSKLSFMTKLALSLILSGALGNFFDRLRLSYVVDFISLRFWGLYDFPVFNIADIAIVVGGALLLILGIFLGEFNDES